MIGPRQALRLMRINRVLIHHGLEEFVVIGPLQGLQRLLLRISPWNWGPRHTGPRGVRLREAMEELGPIFVKFGQVLSTRRDLLPDDIADELAKLQDRVPPFPSEQARTIIETSLKQPLDALFQEFDDSPLASASIAQVHTAQLFDGSEVVVKVVRPAIGALIERDLSVLRGLAALAERFWKDARRFRPAAVVAEIERTLVDELDLRREGANGALLRRNFEGSEQLYVPEIYWDYTSEDVLVMERIHGTPIAQLKVLERQGIDMERLGANGVEVFFTQVFRHNFFHADMHPGNIFVEPSGRYIAVDFGIMGSLEEADKHYMAEIFLAFFRRDYTGIVDAHVDAGWVDAQFRKKEMEAAVRTVCEPVFQRPLSEISFAAVLMQVFQVARRFDFEVQPQLILLHKTLLNIEGLGRQIYPQLDLWATAQPFFETWMAEQLGPRAVLRHLRRELPHWGALLPELPSLHHQLLKQAIQGDLKVDFSDREVQALKQELHRSKRHTLLVLAGAALVGLASIALVVPEAFAGSGPWWLVTGLGAGLLLAALGRH